MKSNYKKLGPYIRQVDVRNKDLSVTKLLGVSIEKKFIPSIANTVGTDFKNYKIVRNKQFAYGPVTSRNGDKISVALLNEESCIISSSYSVFEIVDLTKLIPEYLMLWFSRPEFDRYARYKSHGSVREIFDWEQMCSVELPIPPLGEQKRIVDEYNVITKRIALKKKINENLIEQAKTYLRSIYGQKKFFKSTTNLDKFCSSIVSGGTPNRAVYSYWDSNDIPWLKNGEIKNNLILSTEEYISKLGLSESSAKLVPTYTVNMAMYCVSDISVALSCVPLSTNQAVLNLSTDSFRKACFIYYLLMTFGNSITSQANGSAQQNLSKEKVILFEFLSPILDDKAFNFFEINMRERICIAKEIVSLNNVQTLLLSNLSY
ncbi:MAG: restriction endonuclease subunit S [Clostridia bacterium]|nr:restriction endonuclease subunit S [Clostridia bacterium]